MNKVFLFLVIFTSFVLKAQDSLQNIAISKRIFTDKDVQVDADTINQIAFQTNFKNKYQTKEFIYELKTPEKNIWDRFLEWLSRMIQNIFNFSNNKMAMDTTVTILKILAVLLIGFVVYKIIKALLNKEGQWIFGKNTQKKIASDDPIERQLQTTNFESLIKKTLAAGQDRLTLRYYYLWLLKRLSEKQIIEWDLEKTNSDYLYEIKNEAQKVNFAYLSYLYNYSWYGAFEMDDETFQKAKLSFETTLKSLGS